MKARRRRVNKEFIFVSDGRECRGVGGGGGGGLSNDVYACRLFLGGADPQTRRSTVRENFHTPSKHNTVQAPYYTLVLYVSDA